MGFKTLRTLECDRCGASVPAEDAPLASFELAQKHPGWTPVQGDRHLCPKCSPGYEVLMARHRVQLEEYLSGK